MEAVSAVEAATQSLSRGHSVEVSAGDLRSIDIAAEHFDSDTEVFVACLPKDPLERLVDASARLRRAGLNPVPHLVARNIVDKEGLDHLLRSLRDRAAVERVLVLAGDRNDPAGEYTDSLQLIESNLLQENSIARVYISAYPEGHPKVDDCTLEQARRAKLAALRRRGHEVCMISQFCFDAEPILRWIRGIRSKNDTTPYRIGVAGPASQATLLKYALICGVGPSLRFLRGRDAIAKNLLFGVTPDSLLRQVAEHSVVHPTLDIEGVHFFTFGALEKTTRWLAAKRNKERTWAGHTF